MSIRHRGRVPLLTVVLLLFTLAIGAGSWWVLRLRQQQRGTLKRLQEANAQLEAKRTALSALETQHHQLSDEYNTLKARWNRTDQELQQLAHASAQMKTELTALSGERSGLQQQVEAAVQRSKEGAIERQALQQQLAALRRELQEIEANREAVAAQLDELVSRSPTPAELAQLSETFTRQRQEVAQLTERVGALSRAAEEAEMPRPSHPPTSAEDARQQALRYRQFGERYLATYQYPKAAKAFERSLTYRDDPLVHAKLAFLYSRLVPNQQKWAYHAAHAPPGYPAQLALDGTAGTQGLPRSSRRLFWDWLTK